MDENLIKQRKLEYEKTKRDNLERQEKELQEQLKIKYQLRLIESRLPLTEQRKCDFSKFDVLNINQGEKIIKLLKEFISFDGENKLPKFLTLYGNTGRGKTFLSYIMGFEVSKNNDVLYWGCSTLLDELRKRQSDNSYFDFMDELRDVYFLIIDDFGDYKDSEFVTEKLDMLINYRYENNKLTLISTNKEDLVSLSTLNKRIGSRLISGICLKLVGKDYRVEMAKKRGSFI
jgi:DNA replication protein DnaC